MHSNTRTCNVMSDTDWSAYCDHLRESPLLRGMTDDEFADHCAASRARHVRRGLVLFTYTAR